MSIITDEMVEAGLVASCRDYANGVCDKPCFQCNRDVRAVLAAVAPAIRAAALEEAAKVANAHEFYYRARVQMEAATACNELAGSIRALKQAQYEVERGDE